MAGEETRCGCVNFQIPKRIEMLSEGEEEEEESRPTTNEFFSSSYHNGIDCGSTASAVLER